MVPIYEEKEKYLYFSCFILLWFYCYQKKIYGEFVLMLKIVARKRLKNI